MNARQRGVAIVLAMGVVALAAIAATAIAVSQSTWARRNELSTEHVQAQAMVGAGVDWARAVLSDDLRATGAVDHLGEPWALRLPPIPIDNGELLGHIEDAQGKFNLNNLVSGGKVDIKQLENFQRLLAILGLPPELADALADWIDADSEPQPQDGAEDGYYLALDPPYLAANRPLIDVEELALVRGFDAGVRARLRPFVTALPGSTQVNVNTAPPEVLAATIKNMDIDMARALVLERERAYFRDPAEFYSRLPPAVSSSVSVGDAIVKSDYFIATLRVKIGDAQARGTALLARAPTGFGWPVIVWRKIS